MSTHDDVEHRARHTAPGEQIDVREVDIEDRGGEWFAIRMPISSTAEARDGDAFTRDRLEGWQRQISEGTVPVFADHGRNDDVADSRYSAFGKFGYYANADLVERDGEADLVADTVVLDPADLPEETGEYRRHLAILKAQAEAGMPITASVGWSTDTGDRDVPGDSDLLEGSIVGIPSDARADATASQDAAVMARAVSEAADDFDVETFVRELRAQTKNRALPEAVVDELGDRLVPGDGVVEAAQQALDWAEEYPEEFALGSEDGEGLRRARQLVEHGQSDELLDGENDDGTDYWTEIEAFHSRHHAQGNHELDDEFEGEPWRDAGYVAHLAWGGDAGYSQAQEVVAALEALADDDDVDYERDTSMTEDDTEPDEESGTDTDTEEERAEMEELMAEMVDMQEEQTSMLREMYEEQMDGDDGEDGGEDEDEGDEEESADVDDEDDGRDEEPEDEETRTVTLDGEEKPVDEALADLRDQAADAEPADPETQDRASEDAVEDGEDSDTTTSGFGMAAMED